MAWVRPSRSRPNRPSPNRPRPRRSGPGQEGGVDGNSGGGGGSSLPGGGPAALGGGGTGLGRRRGARAPRDQCHQPAQIATYPSCRRGFRPLPLASAGSGATGMHQGRCCRYRSAAPWSVPRSSMPPARAESVPGSPWLEGRDCITYNVILCVSLEHGKIAGMSISCLWGCLWGPTSC